MSFNALLAYVCAGLTVYPTLFSLHETATKPSRYSATVWHNLLNDIEVSE